MGQDKVRSQEIIPTYNYRCHLLLPPRLLITRKLGSEAKFGTWTQALGCSAVIAISVLPQCQHLPLLLGYASSETNTSTLTLRTWWAPGQWRGGRMNVGKVAVSLQMETHRDDSCWKAGAFNRGCNFASTYSAISFCLTSSSYLGCWALVCMFYSNSKPCICETGKMKLLKLKWPCALSCVIALQLRHHWPFPMDLHSSDPSRSDSFLGCLQVHSMPSPYNWSYFRKERAVLNLNSFKCTKVISIAKHKQFSEGVWMSGSTVFLEMFDLCCSLTRVILAWAEVRVHLSRIPISPSCFFLACVSLSPLNSTVGEFTNFKDLEKLML